MIKSLFFQFFTIGVYMWFLGALLVLKFWNLFISTDWAIKLLYTCLNVVCENVVCIEDNWVGKIMCQRKRRAPRPTTIDDHDSFDRFIQRIKNEQMHAASVAAPAAAPAPVSGSTDTSALFPGTTHLNGTKSAQSERHVMSGMYQKTYENTDGEDYYVGGGGDGYTGDGGRQVLFTRQRDTDG